MLPTIIFFFALAFTLATLVLFNNVNNGDIPAKDEIKANALAWSLVFLICGLWSWLFYLLH